MKKIFLPLIALLFLLISCEKDKDEETLIFQDDFETDLSQWTIEQVTGGSAKIVDGKLEVDDKDGCTIWFNDIMKGNIRIEYDVVMIDEGGPNDRVSDLNCFWKAIDPKNPDNILTDTDSRTGKFNNYHYFRLYYIGFGARDNTTTRFRRYPGDGTRPLLPEHDLDDESLMNIANQKRHVTITCLGNQVKFEIDDITVFNFTDEEPFVDGWFGFRTVANHMTIDNFQVFAI